MVGDLKALFLVLAISLSFPSKTQPANGTQSRQELLSFYTEMERQGKVFRNNNTTTSTIEPHSDPFICMVSVMKDEELFVDEWIAYHLFIGIDYFFICDHGNNSFHTFLAPHINAGYLTVMPWFQIPPITGMNDQFKCYEMGYHLMNESKLTTTFSLNSWLTHEFQAPFILK